MTIYCGVDFHVRLQTVCYCNLDGGEIQSIQLHHSRMTFTHYT